MKNKWSIFLTLAWFAVILVNYDVPGRIEGSFFPVAKDFVIEQIKPVFDGVEIYGSFNKARKCNFVSIEGYIETSVGRSNISVDFRDLNLIRTPGTQQYGPWLLHTKIEDVSNINLYTKHACHPFWDTVTRLLPQ